MSRSQDDGSEDVADFLERIRELGDRTKREDEERSRKLEEEILQGRKEREIRRAERARSISPTKESPMTTPPRFSNPRSPAQTPTRSLRAAQHQDMANPITRNSIDFAANDKKVPETLSLNLDLEPSKPSPPPTSTLSRSGTLSWQQRPTSKSSSRPNSLLSLDNKVSLSPRVSPAPETDRAEPSRQDIMRSFEGKDPSWFKQTAERGFGSAAYRKSQENDPIASSSVKLPGLNSNQEESTSKLSSSRISQDSMPIQKPVEARSSWSMQPPSSAKSALPSSNAQRFEPPTDTSRETSPTRQPAMSPAQRNISPERPVSPTKGLGGFVQSAMLKRSDSLNKHRRGGSQAALPLSRSNSVLNNQRDSGELKETAPIYSSKPPEESIRQTEVNVPTSPSRTIDSKRWSPTKQSWLEGAISKNDAPRPKSGTTHSPPMWLSELQKSKDSNSSANFDKPIVHKPIETGGFLRTSQDFPKTKGELSAFPVSVANGNVDTGKQVENSTIEKSAEATTRGLGISSIPPTTSAKPLPADTQATQSSPKLAHTIQKSSAAFTRPPPITSPKPDISRNSPSLPQHINTIASPRDLKSAASTPIEAKPKIEEPVKKDFRAGLRSVGTPADKSKNQELEFKNVFGKLKKAETKNYVAPDELKANILRGKTGLNVTGGPRVFEKKDDFKDSILKKKEEMKAGVSSKAKSPEPAAKPSLPEAIAKQQKLSGTAIVKPAIAQEKPAVVPKPFFTRTQSATAEPTKATAPITSQLSTEPKSMNIDTAVDEPLPTPGASKQSSIPIEPKKSPVLEKKTSAPAQLQGNALGSTFADRFNPGLASIIARGPSGGPNGKAQPPRTASPLDMRDESAPKPPSTTTAKTELTHATKGRAKGPKRRLPGNAKGSNKEDASSQNSKPLQTSERSAPIVHTKPLVADIGKSKVFPTTEMDRKPKPQASASLDAMSQKPPVTASKPQLPTLGKVGANAEQQVPSASSKGEILKGVPLVIESTESKDESQLDEKQKPLVAPKSPELSSKSPKSPKSPPTPGNKPKALSRISSNGQTSDRLSIPVPGGTLHAFFDNLLLPKINTDIDTQALLSNHRANEINIRTLKKDIWEITGDGKKTPLSQHQEYILFEDRMYLCRHHYEDEHGKQIIDAYLWCGDGVSPAAIEDAQVFCGSTAREAGCKLQTLSQGKETVKFFEALGGIVITRRRDSATYMLCGRRHLGRVVFDEVEFSADSLCSGFTFIIATTGGDLYLWKGKGANADEIGCARLIGMDLGLTGEIEEVEEGKEPSELLQALKVTRLDLSSVLWKHKASNDKYDTRLFNVDADTRSRSNSSLSNFAANMWRRRPSSPSLAETNEGRVKEISPYSQSDILEDQIFVLDAFFEIFVVAGSQTRSKFSSFTAALNFAQEYGILSVSIQDRPFIPKGYVIFLGAAGEIPSGFCTAFRKWDPRIHRQQSSWAAENVVMPLNDALRALEGLDGSS